MEDGAVPTVPPSRQHVLGRRSPTSPNSTEVPRNILSNEDLLRFIQAQFQEQNAKLELLLDTVRVRHVGPVDVYRPMHVHESHGVSEPSEASSKSKDSSYKASQPVPEEDQEMPVGEMDTNVMTKRFSIVEQDTALHKQRASQVSEKNTAAKQEVQGQSRIFSFSDKVKAVIIAKDFSLLVSFIVLLNVIQIGAEVEISSALPEDEIPEAFPILSAIFVFIYAGEIIIKFIGFGIKGFFCGSDARWNCFDFLITVGGLVEIVFAAIVAGGDAAQRNGNLVALRAVRLFKLSRLIRFFKFVRSLRHMSSLSTLMHCVSNTTRFLVWIAVLLFLMIYLVSLALTQLVTEQCRFDAIEASGDVNATPQCKRYEAMERWAPLSTSMITLFKCITGGLDWGVPFESLVDTSMLAAVIFVVFIFFAVFAFLNIVTGVYCHSAIDGANADKDIATMVQLQKQQTYTENIREIFQSMDEDASERISLAEFEASLGDERMSAYLESLNIPTWDAWTLFKLIDTDEDGCLDLEEFVVGCMNLRGPAKAIHLAKMSYENAVARRELAKISKRTCEIIEALQKSSRGLVYSE